MVFSKEDIKKAQERLFLKRGKELYGNKVKSLKNLETETKKPKKLLGESLFDKAQRMNKGFKSYAKKK